MQIIAEQHKRAYFKAMPNARATPQGQTRFLDLVLTPSRSLSTRGFFTVMSVMALLSFGIGSFFLLQGAWPVFGFFGLDVALLYWAFRVNFRDGRLSEHIVMDKDHLSVKRSSPSKGEEQFEFPPTWVRVQIDRPIQHHSQLKIASHGKQLIIGVFLPPEERGEVADVIEAALLKRKASLHLS